MKHELITLLNDHAATRSRDAYRPQSGTSAQTAYRDRLACWALRILSGAGGMPSYLQPGRASLASLAELVAVPELADVAASSHAVHQAIAAAVLRLGALNQTGATRVAQDCGMLRTVNWLAQGAGLDPLERDIFEFAVAACAFTPLRCALASWSAIGHGEAISAVAGVLQVTSDCVANALQARGRLLSSGLLKFKVHFEEVFTELLYPPRRLVQSLPYHEEAPALILGNLVVPMPPARLSLADFTHLQHDIRLAHCWLAGALHAVGQKAGRGGMVAATSSICSVGSNGGTWHSTTWPGATCSTRLPRPRESAAWRNADPPEPPCAECWRLWPAGIARPSSGRSRNCARPAARRAGECPPA